MAPKKKRTPRDFYTVPKSFSTAWTSSKARATFLEVPQSDKMWNGLTVQLEGLVCTKG